MQTGSWNKLAAKVAALSMLLSTALPFQAFAQETSVHPIRHFSPEQKQALHQLNNWYPAISPDINLSSGAPTRIIVEFKRAPARVEVLRKAAEGERISPSEALEEAVDDHEAFRSYVSQLTAKRAESSQPAPFQSNPIEITREYHHAFNGVAMTLPGSEIESLLKSGVVKRIFRDHEVKLDPKETELPTSSGQPFEPDAPAVDNTIPLNGIYDLHAAGITGKGIKVGVLDTGIDYNHPDLTDAYKGYRAMEGIDPKTADPLTVKGWDFIDNDADPMETTYADWQASGMEEHQGDGSYYTYHGTHVSGTIAARAVFGDAPVLGVAPEADLYAYRVLGPYGSGAESGILAGIDKSVEDGMDVINLSLGVMVNDALMAESVAINNATLLGVTCAVAAGNAGPNEKTMSSPGTSPLGITVGASDFPITLATMTASVTADGTNPLTLDAMKMMAGDYDTVLASLLNTPLEVVDVGLADTADLEGKDMTGKVAFIQRGEIALETKIVNAARAGAIAAILSNNADGEIPVYVGVGQDLIPTFRATKAAGDAMKAMTAPTVTFTSLGSAATEGGHLADFSGRGPVNGSYDIKPDVVGPGVSVYSTYPEYVHSPEPGIDYSRAYARISGTSMATPHVAGIAALILQAHPDYTPFDVRQALMNTADDLTGGNYSVYQAGAGEVDVTEAVNADMAIEVLNTAKSLDESGRPVTIDNPTGLINFGNFAKTEGLSVESGKEMTITNKGGADKAFNVEVEYFEGGGVSPSANGITVQLNESAPIAVAAGASFKAWVRASVPSTATPGIYEGYVHFVNAENAAETYQVPFAIRVVEPGIDYMKLSNPAFRSEFPPVAHPFEEAVYVSLFKLNSPMKTIDSIVFDEEGNPIGSFSDAPYDATDAPVDEEIYIMVGPYYNPYIGDPANGTRSTDFDVLPEGKYSMRLIATDEQGRTFTKDTAFVVDNTRPNLTFLDREPGVYEVNDGMFATENYEGEPRDALWIHANLYDDALEDLSSLGVTQSGNHLYLYKNNITYPDLEYRPEANGDVKIGIERSDLIDPETKKDVPLTIALFPIDMATNGYLVADFQHYGFIKEGLPYVVPEYDKDKLYLNDEVTMTLNLNNVKSFVSGQFTAKYFRDLYQFVGVQVNPAFQALAEELGASVTLDEPVIGQDDLWESKNAVKLGASLTGSDFKGLDGDMPFLDVTFKLVEDEYYVGLDKMNIEQHIEPFTYGQAGLEEPQTIPVFNQIDGFKVMPSHSLLTTQLWPEAFMTFYEDYADLDWSKDYAQLGAKAYARDRDGNRIEGEIGTSGAVIIHDIPVEDGYTDVYVEVPGHLTSKLPVKLGRTMFGEFIGSDTFVASKQPLALAGDVNNDDIIDILDAEQVAKQYDKRADAPYRIEDLNQDGVVDAKDMQYIVDNFLEVGPEQAGTTPQETIHGKTLEDFVDGADEPSPGLPVMPNAPVAPAAGGNGIELKPGAGEIKAGNTPEGQSSLTVTPDEGRLAKALELLKQADAGKRTVDIRVEQAADRTDMVLPAAMLADTAKLYPDAAIAVETGEASFKLPLIILSRLDPDLNAMTITISLAVPNQGQRQFIGKAAKAQGITLIDAVNFTVTIAGKGKSEELTNFGGTYVSRTITAEGQDEGKRYMAVLIDPETGALSFIPAAVTAKDGHVKAVIQAPHASLYAIAEMPSKSFADVTGHWAQKEVEDLASRLLIKGMSADTFAPGLPVTRAEFTAMLARALGLEMTETATSFADVPADKWYASAVRAMADAWIVTGRSRDAFEPSATISREEMAVMLAGALAFAGNAAERPSPLTFTDKASIAGWAQDAVALTAGAGILQGNGEGAFVPKAKTTRAEAAVALKRWLAYAGYIN
ncbi:S8 family serine peptidase [Paenibacillus silvisoli]|uniref:S8 family serine peptidase n=1 Tax=Paenibacillus silvisoli TaxID=3110539 RepID=UPI002803B029|nr:S8 family serine peptidase [Paenibacillus silvisoli]